MNTKTQLNIFVSAALCALFVTVASPKQAEAQLAADGMLVTGVDQDTSGVGRAMAGVMYAFGKFGVDAHVAFEGFLRLNSDVGITAHSLTLLDVGVRYSILTNNSVGPYLTLGGGYGLFSGNPRERKVIDSATCASTDSDSCTYRIDKNVTGRFGVGYGFQPFKDKATVIGIRVDLTYWMFSLEDHDPKFPKAPIPRQVPRPQDTWSILFGLEFMRWM